MIEQYLPYVIIVLLIALLVWEKNRFDGRERDLLNRLMARDYREYVEGTNRLEQPAKSPDGAVPIEQAVDILAEEGLLADQKREPTPTAAIRVS